MFDLKVRMPQCEGRPCYLRCEGNIPQKIKGKTLLPGKRYCAGDNRIKPFRPSDPKIRVPTWCPLRKTPAELRIYCFKDSLSAWLREMLRRDGIDAYPNGTDYALRYEGTTLLTAMRFRQELREKSVRSILNLDVCRNEVVEIDDGLHPYYFFFSEKRPMPYVVDFNKDSALKNQLEKALEDFYNGSKTE